MLLKKIIGKIQYIQAFVDETLKRPRLFTIAVHIDVDGFPAKYPGVDHLIDCAQRQHQHSCQTELQLVPELLFPASFRSWILTIYACTYDLYSPVHNVLLFSMRAYPLRGEVGGGWALEFSSFFWALWNGIEPIGDCHLGPIMKKLGIVQCTRTSSPISEKTVRIGSSS